jgi:RNA polymerase sigma factor (sigma-70 family)
MSEENRYDNREVVEGCIDNNRKHQEALYRKFFPAMMGMCMRYTKDTEIAMTIVNDGFLKVFKRIQTYEFKGSLEGWIRRIVFHSLSDYFRRESKYIQFMVFDEKEESQTPNAYSEMYLQDLIELVDDLPPMTGKVFSLYAIEGYNHREIGDKLDISENTSKWHLANARKKLREMIEQQQSIYEKKRL